MNIKQRFQSFSGENGLRIGGVKIIVHEITGDLEPSQKRLNRMVLEIHEAGFQAVLHAVEEKTIEAACNAIEYALKQLPRHDHRHRIEHCSCLLLLPWQSGSVILGSWLLPSRLFSITGGPLSGDRSTGTVGKSLSHKEAYKVSRQSSGQFRFSYCETEPSHWYLCCRYENVRKRKVCYCRKKL